MACPPSLDTRLGDTPLGLCAPAGVTERNGLGNTVLGADGYLQAWSAEFQAPIKSFRELTFDAPGGGFGDGAES